MKFTNARNLSLNQIFPGGNGEPIGIIGRAGWVFYHGLYQRVRGITIGLRAWL